MRLFDRIENGNILTWPECDELECDSLLDCEYCGASSVHLDCNYYRFTDKITHEEKIIYIKNEEVIA